MAKLSTINRNEKRQLLVKKFRAKRDALRKKVSDFNATPEERWQAALEMQKLPRDSSRSRVRNRCLYKHPSAKKPCGRPRAVVGLTGICRMHTRMIGFEGLIPGLHKASW